MGLVLHISFALLSRHVRHYFLGRSDDEVIARTNEWLYSIGADSVHVSPLADSITARFANDVRRAWRHLPSSASHPLAFDFVIRRDARPKNKDESLKQHIEKPDEMYTVWRFLGCSRSVLLRINVVIAVDFAGQEHQRSVWNPGRSAGLEREHYPNGMH